MTASAYTDTPRRVAQRISTTSVDADLFFFWPNLASSANQTSMLLGSLLRDCLHCRGPFLESLDGTRRLRVMTWARG
jgi:hypothetical protein